MKKNKRLLALIVGVLIVMSSTGCDTYEATEHYPWYKSDTWYCELIDMQLCFRDSEGKNLASNGFAWTWNEVTYEVSVGFMTSTCDFYQRISADSGSTLTVLLRCRWEYVDGNMVVTILEDHLFKGEITELIFVPQG